MFGLNGFGGFSNPFRSGTPLGRGVDQQSGFNGVNNGRIDDSFNSYTQNTAINNSPVNINSGSSMVNNFGGGTNFLPSPFEGQFQPYGDEASSIGFNNSNKNNNNSLSGMGNFVGDNNQVYNNINISVLPQEEMPQAQGFFPRLRQQAQDFFPRVRQQAQDFLPRLMQMMMQMMRQCKQQCSQAFPRFFPEKKSCEPQRVCQDKPKQLQHDLPKATKSDCGKKASIEVGGEKFSCDQDKMAVSVNAAESWGDPHFVAGDQKFDYKEDMKFRTAKGNTVYRKVGDAQGNPLTQEQLKNRTEPTYVAKEVIEDKDGNCWINRNVTRGAKGEGADYVQISKEDAMKELGPDFVPSEELRSDSAGKLYHTADSKETREKDGPNYKKGDPLYKAGDLVNQETINQAEKENDGEQALQRYNNALNKNDSAGMEEARKDLEGKIGPMMMDRAKKMERTEMEDCLRSMFEDDGEKDEVKSESRPQMQRTETLKMLAMWEQMEKMEKMERIIRMMNMDPMGMGSMGMDPMGMDPMDMDPMGMDPMGMDPMGMDPMGMDPMGMDSMGMGPNQMEMMEMMIPMMMMMMNQGQNQDPLQNMMQSRMYEGRRGWH